MPVDLVADTGREFGITDPGVAFDLRPGSDVGAWDIEDGYAWQVESGPAPITLMPAIFHPDWATTEADTGPFARWGIDRFNVLDGAFEQYGRLHAKDHTLNALTDTFELETHETFNAGVPFYVNFAGFSPQLTNEKLFHLRFGGTDDASSLFLTLYENGKGRLTLGGDADTGEKYAEWPLIPLLGGTLNADRWHRIVVLPYGRDRILFHCAAGRTRQVRFPWISRAFNPKSYRPSVTGNVKNRTYGPATSVGKLKIKGFGPRLNLQVSPIHFTGTSVTDAGKTGIRGRVTAKLQRAVTLSVGTPLTGFTPLSSVPGGSPPAGHGLLDVDYEPTPQHGVLDSSGNPAPYAGLIDPPQVSVQATVEFHENPATGQKSKKVQITADMVQPVEKESDYYQSPFLFRIEGKAEPTRQTKPSYPVSFMKDLIEINHNHSEDALSGTIRIRNAQNYKLYRGLFNLPFQFILDGNIFLECLLSGGKFTPNGGDQTLEWQLQDMRKWLKTAIVASESRWDGLRIDEAVKKVLIGAGFPNDGSQWDIDVPLQVRQDEHGKSVNDTFTLSKGEADDKATNLNDIARSAYDWIDYFVDTYTSSPVYPFKWVWGFRPYYDADLSLWRFKFYLKNPATLSTDPVWNFYPTRECAIAADPTITPANCYQYLHWDWTEEIIEPECNYLVVGGMSSAPKLASGLSDDQDSDEDDGAGEPLIAVKEDEPSQLSNTEPQDRPKNWVGEKRMLFVVDTSLNTQELVNAEAAG